MKKIETIIKPFHLEKVKNALNEIGVEEMTVSEVKGFGRQNTHAEVYRGTEFQVGYLPEIKIELVLPEDRLDAAVAAIVKVTNGTKKSDSKIFVSQIDAADCGHTDKMAAQTA
jgi:nitrogen regulatory protein P-II 1